MTGRGTDRRRARTVAALLVLTALSLLSVDQRLAASSPLADVRSVVATAFGPMERGVDALASPRRWFDADTDERTAALEAEVDRLRAQLRTSTLDRARAAELDALLGLTSAGQYTSVPARVVAASLAQGSERTVTIDVGSSDGVAADMTVINGDGLVGRVLAATASTATVQLAIDPRAQIGVRLAGSQQLGIARGDGARLGFELLDPLEPMAVGDQVVSFGSASGTPYVAGVPVGELTAVSGGLGAATRTGVLAPYVDFSALDLVAVVVEPPRNDPRDAVLPAPSDPLPSDPLRSGGMLTDAMPTERTGG